MKYILVTLLAFSFFNDLKAQAEEYKINFSKDCRNIENEAISEAFKIYVDEKIPFVGVSAYVMDPSVETQLYYRIKRNGKWMEWRNMKVFTEGETADRVSFEGDPIQGTAESIQFKSSAVWDETFVFRLFFPVEKKKR